MEKYFVKCCVKMILGATTSNSRYKKWQNFVVNSSLRFARNTILAERTQFRSLPLLVAAKRCTSVATTIKIAVNKTNRKLETQKMLCRSCTEKLKVENWNLKSFAWKFIAENRDVKNIITSEARIFLRIMNYLQKNWK